MRARPLILIVEDEPDILLLLRINLESAGFDTALAADGLTAIGRVDSDRPDAILLDMMLPVMDGWTVLADLGARSDPPPVVVCSAKDGGRDIARASELGASAYVTKPFDMADVIDAIRRSLGQREGAGYPALGPLPGELGIEGAEPA